MGKKFNVLAIGDSCNDIYVYGKCVRLCPDAPVPILLPEKKIITDGMLGNVVNNIKVFGIEPQIITNNVKVTKTRYVDERTNQMIVRIDEGENNIERVKNLDLLDLSVFDAIIISDYCKGFLEEEDIEYICNNNPLVFIDTKKIIDEFCKNAFLIKINQLEYELSKRNINKINNFYDSLIITLGNKGASWKDEIYPVEKVDIKDQTGAGDTFIVGLMIKYLETKNIDKSIEFANKCATYVVQKRGVAITFPYEH